MTDKDAPPDPPTRGELWLTRMPRGVGMEAQRDRPAVIVSSPTFNATPMRIIVPLTTWRDEFAGRFNKLLVRATKETGLHVDSAADVLQVRSVSTERFVERLGKADPDLVDEVIRGILIALERKP